MFRAPKRFRGDMMRRDWEKKQSQRCDSPPVPLTLFETRGHVLDHARGHLQERVAYNIITNLCCTDVVRRWLFDMGEGEGTGCAVFGLAHMDNVMIQLIAAQ
jgi:hypothetical protein